MGPVSDDPILARRARMARLAEAGQRVGYGLLLLAIVAFVWGAVAGFSGAVTTTVTLAMLGTTLTLAPAIVLGYAVKAAAREDTERPHR